MILDAFPVQYLIHVLLLQCGYIKYKQPYSSCRAVQSKEAPMPPYFAFLTLLAFYVYVQDKVCSALPSYTTRPEPIRSFRSLTCALLFTHTFRILLFLCLKLLLANESCSHHVIFIRLRRWTWRFSKWALVADMITQIFSGILVT